MNKSIDKRGAKKNKADSRNEKVRFVDDLEDMMDDDEEDGDPGSENLFREVEERPISLPTYGQVQIRQFHTRSSAFGKLLAYQQVLQLGMIALKTCFDPVICPGYIKDDSFMEQLFCVVFIDCSQRRMMLEGEFICGSGRCSEL